MLFSLPQLAFAALAQLTMVAFNDLSVTFLNELIVTSTPPQHFRKLQALGQWLRRLGNTLTAFTGPMLCGFAPWLPFAVYGAIVFIWSFVLWIRLYLHAREIAPLHMGNGPISAFAPFAEKDWHVFERDYIPIMRSEQMQSNLAYHLDTANEQRVCSLREQVEKLGDMAADVRELQDVVESSAPLMAELSRMLTP